MVWFVAMLVAACEAAPAGKTPALGSEVKEVSRACWYVHQAPNGDLWFGSDGEGVYRHDGKKLFRYTTADGLCANSVRGVQSDKHGNVYFTTFAGISRFDGSTFRTLPVAPTPADGGWRLAPDDLWFPWFKGMPGAPDTEGPYRFDGTSLFHLALPTSELEDAFLAQYPQVPYSPYETYEIYRDDHGHVWIGTSHFGACRYDGKSFGWLYEKHHSELGGAHFGVRAIVEDRDGDFWICNTQNRFAVEPGNREGKVPYASKDGIARALVGELIYFQGAVRDPKGTLWLAPYGGGIWRWDGERVTNFPVRFEGRDIQVVTISMDNAGGLWLGTPSSGPYRFNGTSFEPFRPDATVFGEADCPVGAEAGTR